jgi:hypothetical protein
LAAVALLGLLVVWALMPETRLAEGAKQGS